MQCNGQEQQRTPGFFIQVARDSASEVSHKEANMQQITKYYGNIAFAK